MKMIILNNPNNPTGATISEVVLSQIVEFAKARGIIIFSDEVYRPLFHNLLTEPASIPPPATTLGYEKTIVTGSMSKAFALAGIRVGWIASRSKEILAAIESARDYTTITVSQVDDQIAAYALSEGVLPSLLKRNVDLARANMELLDAFVNKHSSVCSWTRPVAGTTALIQFKNKGIPVDDVDFCVRVIEETRVFFVPASKCFGRGEDFAGFVRVGYVCHTEVLREGLEKLGVFVDKHLVGA